MTSPAATSLAGWVIASGAGSGVAVVDVAGAALSVAVQRSS